VAKPGYRALSFFSPCRGKEIPMTILMMMKIVTEVTGTQTTKIITVTWNTMETEVNGITKEGKEKGARANPVTIAVPINPV
jgi:hypothetical protein